MKSSAKEKPARASQTQVLLRCFSYLRPHWKLTAGAYGMMLLIDMINIVNPQIIRWAIDVGIPSNQASLMALAVAALLGLVVIKGIFTYF